MTTGPKIKQTVRMDGDGDLYANAGVGNGCSDVCIHICICSTHLM